MAEDPLDAYDASDPQAIANAQKDQLRKEREDRDVVRRILMTKQGRAWLCRILDRCHINNSPFVAGQADVTAFHLGTESIGRLIMVMAMEASTDLYMTMIKEQQEEGRAQADQRKRERETRESAANALEQVPYLPPPPSPVPSPGFKR
jgi:hypothetical protein